VSVPRTQERMWHDVGLPAETVELRGEVRLAVEKAVAPHAAEIGQRQESMAKSFATWLAADMARDVIQVYGGHGFARKVSETGETFRFEELYRDAKILEIFEGANEVLQWVIARQLIGRDVTG
jgi:alkylation response protein AidB-like acyl-CoA dehydrogenase